MAQARSFGSQKPFGIVKMRNAANLAKQHLSRINGQIQDDKSKTFRDRDNIALAIILLEAAPDLVIALDHLLKHVKSPDCPLTHIKRAVSAIDYIEKALEK